MLKFFQNLSQPFVAASYSSASQMIFNAATTYIYEVQNYDTSSGYSGGQFLVTTPGRYLINAGLTTTSGSSISTSGTFFLSILKNGSNLFKSNLANSGVATQKTVVTSGIASLTTNDTITVQALTSATSISSSVDTNWFDITRISD